MSRYLPDLDGPMWRMVRELYYADKVEEALQEAEKLGGRDSNDLYAEAEARSKGTQRKLNPWLTFEVIEAEVPEHLDAMAQLIKTECESLSRQFGWDNREATLVTILPTDVEAPWMPGRWGYFVDKVPYDKVCLPHHLTVGLAELRGTLRHEFMHDITLNLSQGRASRWVEEALSTFAEERLDLQGWHSLKSGKAEWLSPIDLNTMLATDNRRREVLGAIAAGYAQANLLARFLATQYGEATFPALLRAIASNSLWETLQEGIFSRSPVDSALHKLYDVTEAELFGETKAWVASTPIPGQ